MTPAPKLLIVDDGDRYVGMAFRFLRGYRYATRCTLDGPCWSCSRRKGCDLTHAHDSMEMEQALVRHGDVDIVLLDMAFDLPPERLLPSAEPDLDQRRRREGLAILGRLRRHYPLLQVLLMTSREELAYEEDAGRLAVDDYVTLAGSDAFDARAIGLLIERIWARRPETAGEGSYAWGNSVAMAKLKRDATVLGRAALPLLILGETGVGKSALAERVIHPASRRKGPFVSVDLASLPGTLLAAELFGTAKGAYSGAVDRAGRLEQAHGGTLFMDEIGNLPLDAQRLLLLVLESGRVTRLGETKPRVVDVRIVAATNSNLRLGVDGGTFRADLLARLNPTGSVSVPPLRERIEDFPELATLFLKRAFAHKAHRELLEEYAAVVGLAPGLPVEVAFGQPGNFTGMVFVLSSGSVRALRAHPWPGNLRELDHLLSTAAVMTLSDALIAAESSRATAENPRWLPISAKLIRELLRGSPSQSAGAERLSRPPAATLHGYMSAMESDLLQSLFKETGGDFSAMAQRLLIGSPAKNARRVRLRFNQLGLKVKGPRRKGPPYG